MRSLLFVPGDSERKIVKALGGKADVVVLDLEDSVSPDRKQAARELVAEVLSTPADDSSPARYVRINPLSTDLAEDDIDSVLPSSPDGIMQPKTQSGEDVKALAELMKTPIPVIAIATETAAAMFNLGTYGVASPPLAGIAWGAEDLSNDLGAVANRNEAGGLADPYRLARTLCLIGARAAAVDPIDTVFINFRDHDGLERECTAAVRDGFTAKMAIHPDQVQIINQTFTPSSEAVSEARRVVEAFAAAGNPGVIDLDGEMYDIPHLKRAQKLLQRAQAYAAA